MSNEQVKNIDSCFDDDVCNDLKNETKCAIVDMSVISFWIFYIMTYLNYITSQTYMLYRVGTTGMKLGKSM